MHLITSAADFSKETLVVKEEETHDADLSIVHHQPHPKTEKFLAWAAERKFAVHRK